MYFTINIKSCSLSHSWTLHLLMMMMITEQAGESYWGSVCCVYKLSGAYQSGLAHWAKWSAVFPHSILASAGHKHVVHGLC